MKEDIILNKNKTENLYQMLISKDESNKYIALKSIEECDINKSIGYIMILFKFGKVPGCEWSKECPKVWNKFFKINLLDDTASDYIPSSTKLMKVMISQEVKMEVITLFIELHSKELIDTLNAWGYPTDLLNIKITLKENVK